MITICQYHEISTNFHVNWESVTACGTVSLALLTLALVIVAYNQLSDIKMTSLENNIMKQLEFHYKIVDRIKLDEKPEDKFKFMYSLFAKYYFSNYDINRDDEESIKNNIGVSFQELYEKQGNLLGHYFRNLYRILKNINETNIGGFNKRYYAKLVRAQLSEYEVLLLFYNCIWVGDEDKFKKIVEDYELLEGISYKTLLGDDHYKLYSGTAFGTDFS